jgi:hypothetical protein
MLRLLTALFLLFAASLIGASAGSATPVKLGVIERAATVVNQIQRVQYCERRCNINGRCRIVCR